MVALVVGRHAPGERRMGHAGAFTALGQSDAAAKIEALRGAGVHIAEDATRVTHDGAAGASGEGRVNDMSVPAASGRRRTPYFPKGRLLGPEEREAIKAILGARPRERSQLIEYLHLIQDQEGCLPAGQLHALAEELRIPMAEVYEVASFYAHFDIVRDGEQRPPAVTDPRLR